MILYGEFTSTNLDEHPKIDFLEFTFKKPPSFTNRPENSMLSVDWDESDWSYEETGSFRAKGVYIDETYADGFADCFRTAKLTNMQVYGNPEFVLTRLTVVDGSDEFDLSDEALSDVNVFYED